MGELQLIQQQREKILSVAGEYGMVTERGLHWYLRDKIMNEARPLITMHGKHYVQHT